MTTLPSHQRLASRLLLLFSLLVLFLMGATPAYAQGSDCASNNVPNDVRGAVTWVPAFCQEFNSVALTAIDLTVWSFDLGDGCPNNCQWGNKEVEIYCGPPSYTGNPTICPNNLSTSNNAYIDGSGHLVIQAINNGGTWLSTRMKTQGIENFKYGRIEANIQLPDTTNQGLWPAFWSLGTNITSVGWPTCGEDDFMEVWSPTLGGAGTSGNISTIHTQNTDGAGVTTNKHPFTFPSGMANNTALHKYGVIWSANMIQHYVDDPTHPFYIATTSDLGAGDLWPFNASIFILLNLAVGGTLGGNAAGLASPTQPYLVDYVRQYQASAAVMKPTLGNPASITVKAGATIGNSTMLTPGLASGTGFVYLSCATTAPKASCAVATNDPVNPFVVNSSPAGAAETVTVTVATTANSISFPLLSDPRIRLRLPIVILAALLLALAASLLRWAKQARSTAFALAGFALVLALIVGCGGGYSSPPPPPPSGGTTPGSYAVTVYAFTESNTRDGTNANADASVQIPLTVN